MSTITSVASAPCLSEKEAAQLAEAVQRLVEELGYSDDEVQRSYRESYVYFLS
jgi:hypothetical protein